MKSIHLKMFLLGIIVLSALSAGVMLLWNLLMPVIFGLVTINFWQALGLLILTRLLFGGFKFGRKGMIHHRMHENPIHKRWKNMTPEQRKEFIERRKKFGFGGPFGRGEFGMDDYEEPEKRDEETE